MRAPVVKGAACVLLALSGAITGCGGSDKPSSPPSAAPRGATVAVPELPSNLDPARASSLAERAVASATQTPLLTYRRTAGDEAAALEPALAGDLPKLSTDDREYRFQLRSGLVYADGRLVKASDVERAIAHASVAATDPELRTTLASILGAPSKDGQTLPGVRTDDRTGAVVVRLRRPDGRIPLALADPATAPMPELPARGKVPASTGPLRVASSTNRSLELAANPLRPTISTVPAAKLAQVSLTKESSDASPASFVRWDDLKSGEVDVDLTAPGPTGGKAPKGVARVTGATSGVVAAYLPQAGQTASRAVRRALAEAVDTRDVRPTPNGRVSFSATCGLVPSFAVGAVERDPCPAVPVTPKTQPLAGKRLRVAIAQPVSPEGGPPYSPDLEAAARMVKAIKALGGTATVIETRLDPLTLLTVGRADLAIARFTTRLPHPSFWLDTAAQFDALLAREVPRETRGPLTGSGGRWAALERRAVDRAVAIPLLSLQRVVTIGPQIDRRTVLIHPVLGLDLAALDLA